MSLVSELWSFMRERKKWWLLPVIVVMLVVGTLLIFAQGSALAPFIYTIFDGLTPMRRALANLAILMLALGVSVAGGEAILRPFVALPLERPDPEVRYLAHPVRQFTMLPSQEANTYGAAATIDERGFRRNASSPDANGPVLFALGDSFTFGMGVRNEDTWPSRLEALLRDRVGPTVTVVNGGTISYGVLQELDLFRASGLLTRPRVVVHALYWNDFMSPAAHDGTPTLVTPDGYLTWDRPPDDRHPAARAASWVSSHSAFFFSIRQVVALGRNAESGYGKAYRSFLEHGLTAAEWHPIEEFYKELIALGHEHSFSVYVVIMPVSGVVEKAGASRHPYPSEARRRLSAMGIPYLDGFALWEKAGFGKKPFLPQGSDAHLNAEGYRAVAEALADDLLERPEIAGALASPRN